MFAKNKTVCILLLLLVGLTGGLSGLPAPTPIATYLTWFGDPTTTMTISWITINTDVQDVVDVRRHDEEEWVFFLGSHSPFAGNIQFNVHRAHVSNLQPDTEYLFRINGQPYEYKFRTLPKKLDHPLTFVVGGDIYHDEIELVEKTNLQAASFNPSFALFGGDLAYAAKTSILNNEKPMRWIEWLQSLNRSFVTEDRRMIPIVVCIGNHDVNRGFGRTADDARCFYSLFCPPGYQSYRVLDVGDYLSLFLLDSNHTHPIDGEQKQWLDDQLAKRSESIYRAAIYHVPAYPSCRSLKDRKSQLVRKHWVPIFQKYSLNVAFENHDHCYKRTHPLLFDKPDPNGVLYIGDGAWGVRNIRKPKSTKEAPYLAFAQSTRHFVHVTLNNESQRYQAITPEGIVIDDYTSVPSRNSLATPGL